ncbi:caspase-10-like isoform X1 [Pelobates fuscus]|uniref:caspase-10-like isoform X1 n=2 Tax=Pelobates fuscus TaxID=191477 RepID=UPI002FE4F7BD
MEFIDLLYELDSNLDTTDVEAMKYLCTGLLPAKKLAIMTSGQELFEALMNIDLLNEDDPFLVAELLYLIGHHSLLKKLNTTKEHVKDMLQRGGKISDYRRMLFEISENITKQDHKEIIFLLKLTKKQKECKSFLDLLSYLEKMETITKDDLTALENALSKVSPDSLKIIGRYKKEKAQQFEGQTHNTNIMSPTESLEYEGEPEDLQKPPISIQVMSQDPKEEEEPNNGTRKGSVGEIVQVIHGEAQKDDDNAGNIENQVGMLSLNDEQTRENLETSIYAMNHKHRGYCLIVSNSLFMKSLPRQGTQKDAQDLKGVFTWLGFEVETFTEQTADDISKRLEEFSKKDHSDRDCFTCCILTHGESGTVMGTDNVSVPINDVIASFIPTNCPTLAGKPKLFFIQACQGKQPQTAYPIQPDAAISVKKKKYAVSIPADADLLIGMSTVDGHFSYRHVKEGTWYIQALCKNLVEMVPSGEDILSILTKVNRDVSRKEHQAGRIKQMPQPSYTLLKKLIFPVPCKPYNNIQD